MKDIVGLPKIARPLPVDPAVQSTSRIAPWVSPRWNYLGKVNLPAQKTLRLHSKRAGRDDATLPVPSGRALPAQNGQVTAAGGGALPSETRDCRISADSVCAYDLREGEQRWHDRRPAAERSTAMNGQPQVINAAATKTGGNDSACNLSN